MSKKYLNIEGKIFGDLLVLSSLIETKEGIFSLCECSCGNIKNINKYSLLNGHITSCGCKEGFQLQYKFIPGEVKGKLTVIKYLPGKAAWLCKCSCGNIIEANSQRLRNGRLTNCGSIRCKLKTDIVGKKFGYLLVLNQFIYKISLKTKKRHSYVKVKCKCGNEKYVATAGLLSGDILSCGCFKKQRINEAYFDYRISKGNDPKYPLTPKRLLLRADLLNKGIKKKILFRDNFECKLCKNTENLNVHHIIPISLDPALALKETNLITLCSICHSKAHLGNTKRLDYKLIPILTTLISIN